MHRRAVDNVTITNGKAGAVPETLDHIAFELATDELIPSP